MRNMKKVIGWGVTHIHRRKIPSALAKELQSGNLTSKSSFVAVLVFSDVGLNVARTKTSIGTIFEDLRI
jgi:hypothetical protein